MNPDSSVFNILDSRAPYKNGARNLLQQEENEASLRVCMYGSQHAKPAATTRTPISSGDSNRCLCDEEKGITSCPTSPSSTRLLACQFNEDAWIDARMPTANCGLVLSGPSLTYLKYAEAASDWSTLRGGSPLALGQYESADSTCHAGCALHELQTALKEIYPEPRDVDSVLAIATRAGVETILSNGPYRGLHQSTVARDIVALVFAVSDFSAVSDKRTRPAIFCPGQR